MSALTKERTTRILMVIIGNVFIGLGVGLFKLSALGNEYGDG